LKILARNFKLAEFVYRRHRAVTEAGTTIKDVIDPTYWTGVASSLTQGDIIEVVSAETDWYAELFVRSCTKTDAKVAIIRHVSLGQNNPASFIEDEPGQKDTKSKPATDKPKKEGESDKKTDQPYEVKWKGPTNKFQVIRTSDNVVVSGDVVLADKASADEWLVNYLKTLSQ